MIPYPDRLKEHTIAVILCYGYTEGSGVTEFTLMFQSEVERKFRSVTFLFYICLLYL